MSHVCPDCGHLCYCDVEDHESPAPDDCQHECAADERYGFDDEIGGEA